MGVRIPLKEKKKARLAAGRDVPYSDYEAPSSFAAVAWHSATSLSMNAGAS